MKVVIVVLFHLILLAVHSNTYQCPDCLIPCVANSIPNVTNSLLKTFHHRIRDFTFLTFLDAINGDVRFMCSNGTVVFSKTILVYGYTMSELCSILSNTPRLLRTSPYPKIKFRYFPPYLLSDTDESGNSYLFEKMNLLLIEQRDVTVLLRDVIVQLRDVKSDFDVLNHTVRDVSLDFKATEVDNDARYQKLELDNDARYQKLEVDNDARYQKLEVDNDARYQKLEVDNDARYQKLEMRKKLEYAILGALVYGTGMICDPSDYRFQLPMASKNTQRCMVIYPNWMYFELLQEFEFNVIQLYHWDGGSRVVTYSIAISQDGITWTSIIVNYLGRQLVTHRLSQTYTARYIRMQGENNFNKNFILFWVKLDLI